jgi:hypothetical protein
MSEAGRPEGNRARVARRGLLRGLAGGGALVALAAGGAAAEADAAAGDAKPEDDPTRIGFRATEHTKWFYRRARW